MIKARRFGIYEPDQRIKKATGEYYKNGRPKIKTIVKRGKWKSFYLNSDGGISFDKQSFSKFSDLQKKVLSKNNKIKDYEYKQDTFSNLFDIDFTKAEIKKDALSKNRDRQLVYAELKTKLRDQKRIDAIFKKKHLTAADIEELKEIPGTYKLTKRMTLNTEVDDWVKPLKYTDKKTGKAYPVKIFVGNTTRPVFYVSKKYFSQLQKYIKLMTRDHDRLLISFKIDSKDIDVFLYKSDTKNISDFCAAMSLGISQYGAIPYQDYETNFTISGLL